VGADGIAAPCTELVVDMVNSRVVSVNQQPPRTWMPVPPKR